MSLLREFSECALLALPSVEESFPLVVAQAMAAGKPVVATTAGGVPHLVADGATGMLVPPNDYAALARVLLALLADEPRRHRLGAEAARVARERIDPRAVVERTVSVYHEIVAGARGISLRQHSP